jgi:hypothetical protein
MINELTTEIVEFIPDELKDGVIYVSFIYSVAIHKCCCGCGIQVVTPLGNGGWQLLLSNDLATLSPSIGNQQFPCKSHYLIKNGKVIWC